MQKRTFAGENRDIGRASSERRRPRGRSRSRAEKRDRSRSRGDKARRGSRSRGRDSSGGASREGSGRRRRDGSRDANDLDDDDGRYDARSPSNADDVWGVRAASHARARAVSPTLPG